MNKPYVLEQLDAAAYYVDKQLQDIEGNEIKISQIHVGEDEPDPKEYELWIDPSGNPIPARYITFNPTTGKYLNSTTNTQDAITILEDRLEDIRLSNANLLFNWDFRNPIDNTNNYFAEVDTPYGVVDVNGVFTQNGKLKALQYVQKYSDAYYKFYDTVRRKIYYIASTNVKNGFCIQGSTQTIRAKSITRWFLFNNNATQIKLIKHDGYVSIESIGETDNIHDEAGMGQSIPNCSNFLGKTLTFSIMTLTGEVYKCTSVIGGSQGIDTWYGSSITPFGYIGFYGNDGYNLDCIIMIKNSNISLIGAKLEYGTESTLSADDQVFYTEEQIRCQGIYDSDNFSKSFLSQGYGANKNMLINWDFTLPANYQKLDTYSIINGEILSIDSWRMVNTNKDNFTMQTLDSGIKMVGNTEGYIYQTLNPKYFYNQTITFSVVDSNGQLYLTTAKIYGNINSIETYIKQETYFGDVRIVGKDQESLQVEVHFSDCTITLRAAKVEISFNSTLGNDQRISPIESDLFKLMYTQNGKFRSEIRNIKFSTEPPLAEDGDDGDIWFIYEE